MLHACTIIAGNYLPYARVLAESFFAHHSDGSFTILLIDDEQQAFVPGDDRITWMRLGEVGLDAVEIRRLAGIYDVTELSTAVKPLLLRRLLDDGCGEAIYLDPDIRIYDTLEEVAELARRHEIVLTPHTMRPFPEDGRDVDGRFILAAGVYNLGFIAVSAAARPFLDWWWQKTRREALMDVARMMFTDQRVVDFVPAFFGHYILKDPGYNVAYWNLHGREVTGKWPRYFVDGSALRFFHFSGFDLQRPWLLSRNQGTRPRVLLSERPVVGALCRDYAAAVAAAGSEEESGRAYGWSRLPSGALVTTRMRRLYWKALVEAERTGGPEPPGIWDPSNPDAFVDWLNAPERGGPRALSRYLYSIYLDRVDLQVYFRDIHGADAPRFLDWLWQVGIAPESIPMELRPAPAPPALNVLQLAAPVLVPGVNVAGYFRAELGIGEAARLLTTAIDAAGIPYSTTTYDATLNRQLHAFEDRPATDQNYDVNIVCVNADSTARFARDMGPAFFAGRHTIGYWFWEIEAFPSGMDAAFEAVDEIWTATEFVAAAIRTVSRKPVFAVPLPIPVPVFPPLPRAHFGIGDRFVFLAVFDFLSVVERKNPLGAIEAFTRAFAPNEGPVLVLKSINGDLRLNELERLRAAAAERPDVLVIDRYFSQDEKNALIGACDCYVSLHRSEGLGLTLAEAMALAKPVIATAYSGNLHFMTAENSYLVESVPVHIPKGSDPYPESATWADPDLDGAARCMRAVYDRPADAAVRARRGQSDILTRHGVTVSAAAVSSRLQQIRIDRATRVPLPVVVLPQEVPVSLHLGPPPGPSASEPIDALLPQLESLAMPRVSSEGRSAPGIRLTAQRLLFRVLRPYWFQQYQFHKYLIATFGRVATALRVEQEHREALDARVRELTRELVSCKRELRRLEGAVTDLDGGDRSEIAPSAGRS